MYNNVKESIRKDNPFVGLGTSADTTTWHNNIGQNLVAVSAAGLEGAGEPPVWFNFEMPRPGLYGKPPVEFKYGTDEKRVHMGGEYKEDEAAEQARFKAIAAAAAAAKSEAEANAARSLAAAAVADE